MYIFTTLEFPTYNNYDCCLYLGILFISSEGEWLVYNIFIIDKYFDRHPDGYPVKVFLRTRHIYTFASSTLNKRYDRVRQIAHLKQDGNEVASLVLCILLNHLRNAENIR